MLAANPPHHARGDFGLEGDLVVERESQRFTYTGIGLYRPELFAGCVPGKFPLLPLLKRAIAARRLRGEVFRGEWLDIGSPDRLAWLDARERAARGC
jgi:MurNAc alpha-1-phosphate uridylyltransferase